VSELSIHGRQEPGELPSLLEAWAPLVPAPWRAADLAAGATGERLVRGAAWGAALLAHAAVLFALACRPAEPMAGAGGQQLEAISVTIVSSSVLEAREAVRPQPSAASAPEAVDETDGATDREEAAAREQRNAEEEEKEQDERRKEEKPADEPVRAVAAIAAVPEDAERRRRQASAAAGALGGVAARGDRPNPAAASAPAVAASAGAARDYARFVARALAKTKPKGVGRLGTVLVKFTIASDGALSSAEITRSSGSRRLDESALEAVRRTRFPLPPGGMTMVQLTYEVPYHFR
jgi:TonB family protein